MLLSIISFIIGGIIAVILYGKVPVIISLIISFIIGCIIGLISYKIKQRKAENEYITNMIIQRHMITNKKES